MPIRFSTPVKISSDGSTRATSYAFSNKSVTRNGKTYVVYLNAPATVYARTYDHAARTWSEPVPVGDGYDNHSSPALTMDRNGFLHIAYGPHGWWGKWNQGRFIWKKSVQPESIEKWEPDCSFGYNATYPGLAHTPKGQDVIAYRGGEHPCSVMFQRQRALGGWTTAREIFHQDIVPQYTHNGAWVVSAPNGTLYLTAHFYNLGGHHDPVRGPRENMRSYGVAVLKSTDEGEMWCRMDGTQVKLPALYHPDLAVPPVQADARNYGVACSLQNEVWVLTGDCTGKTRTLLLNQWTETGWKSRNLADDLPSEWCAIDGALTIDTKDRLHVVCTCIPDARRQLKIWGDSALEVFHLRLDPRTGNCEVTPLSPFDTSVANWLPTISHAGPFQPVENPVILYTRGVPGEGCKAPNLTEVWCVWTEENT